MRCYSQGIDWSDILNTNDVNVAWSEFKQILLSTLDKIAPIKTIRVKHRTEKWMTPDILSRIEKRDGILKAFNKDKNNVDLWNQYSNLRNSIQKDVKKGKADLIKNYLETNI